MIPVVLTAATLALFAAAGWLIDNDLPLPLPRLRLRFPARRPGITLQRLVELTHG